MFSSLAGTSCSIPSATTTLAGTSTIESPSLSLTTTVTSLIPGVFEISFSLYSGFASASLGNTDGSTDLFTSGSFPTATYWILGSTTVTFAGISAIGSPFSFATTTTSLSPGDDVSTGVKYSNVVPSGKSVGTIFSAGITFLGSVFTGTYCL